EGRVFGVAFGAAAHDVWVLTAGQVIQFDYQANRTLERVAFGGSAGLQGIVYDHKRNRPLFSMTGGREAGVQLVTVNVSSMMPLASKLGRDVAGALAVAAKKNASGQRVVAIPLTRENKLALVDADTSQQLGSVATGIAPFGVAINADGSVAYVTNWGGRVTGPGDVTAPTGTAPDADRVAVDARGVASNGSVTRIDLLTKTVTHQIPVDLHPNGITWDEARARVYVANSNSDSVSVIDSQTQRVVRTIPIQPFSERTAGVAPGAVAVAPNGAYVYVACGGINAIAVIEASTGKIAGLIPTAWYPNSIAVSADGKRIAVSALLGAGSSWKDEPRKRFVHSYRGSVAVIDVPEKAQLASYTTAVAENNHLTLGPVKQNSVLAQNVPASAIPARSGEPSLIEHVVYIIKENRTYDQVLGDMSKGNGDPSLVMFGEDVTPNQHRLADQFVLLDNFYATGGNSADGHQWVTQANETAYCLWPGYTGRSYPFDGADPIAYSRNGFLWDYALARGKTVRIYGEYAGITRAPFAGRAALLERWKKGDDFASDYHVVAPIAPMNKILAAQFPGYSTNIPDVVRARLFLADVKKWEAAGKMPNLVIALLPSNHTNGTTPNTNTPQAMAADNDLALGQMVDALSQTPFWKKMAIFVVEDDAQGGVDHVDGHRTVALAVSPYTKRGHIDSTFYSHQSMLKTIELILGLPTMSLFDLIANDMRAGFTDRPDFTPYRVVTPKQPIDEMNPPVQALRGPARRAALDSARMNFSIPDAAPSNRLNRILWGSVKGWQTPYPATRQAVFAPLSLDLEDEERE
ncbi:MAG: bifunctional YncE family protein/alkaline phosphatase family protein, partial [Bryobacteraceae bacterium]